MISYVTATPPLPRAPAPRGRESRKPRVHKSSACATLGQLDSATRGAWCTAGRNPLSRRTERGCGKPGGRCITCRKPAHANAARLRKGGSAAGKTGNRAPRRRAPGRRAGDLLAGAAISLCKLSRAGSISGFLRGDFYKAKSKGICGAADGASGSLKVENAPVASVSRKELRSLINYT